MKKLLMILINIASILMLIGSLVLFILWLALPIRVFPYIFAPLFAVGLPVYLLTFKQSYRIIKESYAFSKESIKIKAKHGTVYVNTTTQSLKFKDAEVQFEDIVEFQLVNNQTVIDKSGIGESFVGGMLFGGSGAIAGALVGKKQKLKDNYKVFIKTKNIKHAGIVITLKIDNAYNLFETLKLIKIKK